MIKKVIGITLLLFCLNLIPLFSCGSHSETAPALHPVILSTDIMLIEERAVIAYDSEEKDFIVTLELVYENRGERQRAKGRYRTGVTYEDWLSDYHRGFEVTVNSEKLSPEVVSEISPRSHFDEDYYYQFETVFNKGRNVVNLSFEQNVRKPNAVDEFNNEYYCRFYLEDIYKKSLKKFTLQFQAAKGNIILRGVPYKSRDGAVSFKSFRLVNSEGSNILASQVASNSLIYEGQRFVLSNHQLNLSNNYISLAVSGFNENFFENLPLLTFSYSILPFLVDKKGVDSVRNELKELRQYSFASELLDYNKEFATEELDSRSDDYLELLYFHNLAGFMYPFFNRERFREAYDKLAFYFPDEKFTFDKLSEQAQGRFLQLNSYRNNRIQPESYQPFVNNLRLRSESGLTGEVVGKLRPFQPVKLLERGASAVIDGVSGSWVLVEDGRGLKGWCFDGYMEGM